MPSLASVYHPSNALCLLSTDKPSEGFWVSALYVGFVGSSLNVNVAPCFFVIVISSTTASPL